MARKALTVKVDAKNEEIRYGEKKENGEITLKDAVMDKIKERQKAYDRNKEREQIRDTTSQRDIDVYNKLLLSKRIASKQVNQIFYKDLADYRKYLETAQYDKCQIKDRKKHKPDMRYYSASTLNRVIRLVRDVIDEYYRHSDYKSPTEALPVFVQRLKKKTEKDFLIEKEIQIALEYFRVQREQARYKLDETYADIFSFALMTGCRTGELRGLKKQDWDRNKKTLTICRTGDYKDGRTKTESSQRQLPVVLGMGAILSCCFERDQAKVFGTYGRCIQRTKKGGVIPPFPFDELANLCTIIRKISILPVVDNKFHKR